MLTFEEIKELLEIVATRKLEGLELENEGFRLKIEGHQAAPAPAPAATPAPAAPAAARAAPETAVPATTGASGPEEPEDEETEIPEGAQVLNSPIVGTFYRSPAPDADPYVEEGDRVKKGQVLCIVEAMKLMNEIESDVDGTVVRILPENAQPVEFGEPLFAIRPA